MRLLAALVLWAGTAAAQDRAGDFDYYVLALSWQPTWCAHTGARRRAVRDRRRGWSLHGLWPQRERGWPSDCAPLTRDANRNETAAMTDIMGSAGLAWHQWQKHGRCAGLEPSDVFRGRAQGL